MKNKISAIMLGLCALAIMSACNKIGADNILQDANLKIRLHVDSPATTKTIGSATVAAGESEYAISSLDICLVSTTDVSDASTVTIINNPKKLAWKEVSDGNYEVNVIVPDNMTGTYLLYVIANRPLWMDNDAIDTYGELYGSFSGTAANMATCWNADCFLMVNKQDAVGGEAGIEVTMNPGETTAKVTSATVTIERLAAKILVRENPYMDVAPLLTEVLCSGTNQGVDQDIKGAIVDMQLVSYALFNCVNSFNLIQKWGNGTISGEKLLVSPSSATSPVYDINTGYYYNDPSLAATDPLDFHNLGDSLYCMENNSPYYEDLVPVSGDATPGTKMKGRVTGLVFKAKAGYAKEFSGTAKINEDLDIIDQPVTWTRSGSGDIIYSTLYQYKGNYYGDLPCLLNNNPSLAAALGISTPTNDTALGATDRTDALRGKGVKVYTGGEMYYNYWLEDPNYTDNGRKYLSVMRNTFYDVKITAINSMGDEFPCGGDGYDEEDPISVDVPKLSIKMDIPDWDPKEGNYIIQ